MRLLREMLDRRALERLENEQCGLSRKTSFESFYAYDEEILKPKKKRKVKNLHNRQVSREDLLAGMICQRPKSGFARDLNLSRRL